MYKKRYNVAASRARDQLWVVHSLDPSRDLKPEDLRWRLLDFARNPAGLKSRVEQAQVRSESPLEAAVIQRVVTAGYRVTPQFEVGGYRIDLVVGTEKRRLAVECDGDRYHTQDDLQHDLERQALLERLGWRFVRIRGGEFFRDPDRALQPLFKRLAEMGINPDAPVSSDPAQQDPAAEELLQRVRRRAADLRASWDTQPTGRGVSVGDEDADRGAATQGVSAPRKARRRAEPDKTARPEPVLPPPAPVAETPRERRPVRQTSVPGDDLIATLEERGVDYVDKRPNGGALWAIGGAELSTVMSDLAKRGYKFTFSARGGRATMQRPGLWFVK